MESLVTTFVNVVLILLATVLVIVLLVMAATKLFRYDDHDPCRRDDE